MKTTLLPDRYDEKFDLYSQLYDHILHEKLRTYMNFDFECLINKYQTLPFEKYFRHHKFFQVCLVNEKTLLDLVEFVRSTSFYQLFMEVNRDKIRQGLERDPIEMFPYSILEMEGFFDDVRRKLMYADKTT